MRTQNRADTSSQSTTSVGIVTAVINSEYPHLAAREFYQPVAHPVAGAAAYPGMGARLPDAKQTAPTPAPLLGQHNGEIYGGELGYAADELATLRYANII